MIRVRLPESMTAAERLAEIAEILAHGFQRLRAQERKADRGPEKAQNRLDVLGGSEAQCRSMALNPKSTERAR